MSMYYRVMQKGGFQLIDDVGNYITENNPTRFPPDWLGNIIQVRRFIADPMAGDFFLTDTALPETGMVNVAYVFYGSLYDGQYHVYKNGKWNIAALVNLDSYIRGLIEGQSVADAVRFLIQSSLLRIDAVYRVISESDGGQSMAFSSLAELQKWFKAQLDMISEMNQGSQRVCSHEPTIGYIKDNPWD